MFGAQAPGTKACEHPQGLKLHTHALRRVGVAKTLNCVQMQEAFETKYSRTIGS